jgi:prepilin-type N-terminal cleavage/methylation domain-containing protein
MTRRSRARLQRGFSLIEVMIAFTILAVGLLGALAMQTHALSSSNTGKHVGDAMRIGLDRMETLKYQGWATTPVAGWTVPAVVTGPESVAARAGENP